VSRLIIRVKGSIVFVGLDEVDYITAAGNYLLVHRGDQTYKVRGTLTALLPKLDSARFARVHRCTILNLDRINEVKRLKSGDCIVELRDGRSIRMSRTYARKVLTPFSPPKASGFY
jgi:two-component system LytT family response regulator